MDESTRRAWSRPELIVIVRGKSEEAVLDACKTSAGVGPIGSVNACSGCSACNVVAHS